jgi:hypothetical protein
MLSTKKNSSAGQESAASQSKTVLQSPRLGESSRPETGHVGRQVAPFARPCCEEVYMSRCVGVHALQI